jgi:hypothetical protein
MAPSKAHAVQTSARATGSPEPDAVTGEIAANESYVKALRYMGTVLQDAVVALIAKGPGHVQVPVVTFDMQCTVGFVTFIVQVRMAYPADGRIAAQAKAAHCRKGSRVEVDSSFKDIRIVLASCESVRVIEEARS